LVLDYGGFASALIAARGGATSWSTTMDRILRDRGFRTHLIIYAAVNVGLLVINLMSPQPRNYWFIWPLIGWGLGILGHAYLVSRGPDTSAMSKRENGGPGGPGSTPTT